MPTFEKVERFYCILMLLFFAGSFSLPLYIFSCLKHNVMNQRSLYFQYLNGRFLLHRIQWVGLKKCVMMRITMHKSICSFCSCRLCWPLFIIVLYRERFSQMKIKFMKFLAVSKHQHIRIVFIIAFQLSRM